MSNLDYDYQFLNEPLLTTPLDPPDFRAIPWRDLNTPRAFVFVGDKRSGKDVAMDFEQEITMKERFTNLYIFDGGGHEKLYTAINKNCKKKWQMVDSILEVFDKFEKPELTVEFVRENSGLPQKTFEILLGHILSNKFLVRKEGVLYITDDGLDELDGNFLHCNCHKAYPVTVIKPPYVRHSKEEVDRFNGYYFQNSIEYFEAFRNGLVHQLLPANTDFKKIKKPKILTDKIRPMLRIVEAPVPRGSRENINKFLDIFAKEMIHTRDFGGLLVGCDPAMYPPDHEGKADKYTTFAVIMDNLKPIADKYFVPLSLDKPRNEWTKKEKAWHKISLFAGEIRKPVPNQSMSPEQEASVSKRSFFGFMPESRHAKCFTKVNAQSLGDVLKGVNKQQDIIIVKRSSERNLGDELAWLNKAMDSMIEEQMIRWKLWVIKDGKVIKTKISRVIRRELINKKQLCRISELPDNKAVVVDGNNKFRMTTYNSASWHHKSDRDEFANDTGIHFKFDEKVMNRMTETTIKSATKSSKTGKNNKDLNKEVFQKTHEIFKNKMIDKEVLYKTMLETFENDPVKKALIEKKNAHSFYMGYYRYSKSQKT